MCEHIPLLTLLGSPFSSTWSLDQLAEKSCHVCRDDTVEGLRFFENLILQTAPTLPAAAPSTPAWPVIS